MDPLNFSILLVFPGVIFLNFKNLSDFLLIFLSNFNNGAISNFFLRRIVEWIKEMSSRGFPRTPMQVKEIIKSYLDKSGIKVKHFNDNRPGKTWFYLFLGRHPDLKLRKAERLEINRAMACSEEAVNKWFSEF